MNWAWTKIAVSIKTFFKHRQVESPFSSHANVTCKGKNLPFTVMINLQFLQISDWPVMESKNFPHLTLLQQGTAVWSWVWFRHCVWQAPMKHRDASVQIKDDWPVVEEMDFPRLTKLNLPDIKEAEDLWVGCLETRVLVNYHGGGGGGGQVSVAFGSIHFYLLILCWILLINLVHFQAQGRDQQWNGKLWFFSFECVVWAFGLVIGNLKSYCTARLYMRLHALWYTADEGGQQACVRWPPLDELCCWSLLSFWQDALWCHGGVR